MKHSTVIITFWSIMTITCIALDMTLHGHVTFWTPIWLACGLAGITIKKSRNKLDKSRNQSKV